jgi:hypothetical protein
MATSNFYNKNANSIFAAEIENEWDYDDLKLNLNSELKNTNHRYCSIDEYEKDYNRSYPGLVLGCLYKPVIVKDAEATINVNVIVRSGYYSGVNLDWELQIETNYDTVESVDDLTDDMSIFSELTEEEYDSFISECEDTKEELIECVEKIYTQYTTPLGVTARFSNTFD